MAHDDADGYGHVASAVVTFTHQWSRDMVMVRVRITVMNIAMAVAIAIAMVMTMVHG